jgi:hypothetical protein
MHKLILLQQTFLSLADASRGWNASDREFLEQVEFSLRLIHSPLNHLAGLRAPENFSEFSRRESFRLYITLFFTTFITVTGLNCVPHQQTTPKTKKMMSGVKEAGEIYRKVTVFYGDIRMTVQIA